MGIQWSVVVSNAAGSPSGSQNTVQLPQTNTTLVAVAGGGLSAIGIPLDATRLAMIGLTAGQPVASEKWDVSIPIKGSTLIFVGFNVSSVSNGIVIFYFGTPVPGALKAEDLAGVIATFTVTTSGATSATTSLTFTFPAGNIKLTGLYAGSSSSSVTSTFLQFTPAAGYQFNVFVNAAAIQWSPSCIFPLEGVLSGSTLTVNATYTVSAATTYNLFVIFYYKLM